MFRPLPAALAAALCCAPALADHHEKGESTAAVVPARQIADFLEPGNRVEIAVSEFAADHAITPDVKQFARTMVKDHRALADALKQASRRAGAHGDLTRRERRAVERDLRDDGVVTEDEREETAEEMRERREELEDAREDAAEEIEEGREEVREERDDSLGDVVDEIGRDLEEAGDDAAEEARETAGEVRRGARRAGEELRENRRATGRRMAGPRVDLRGEIADKMIGSLKDALGRQEGKQFDMAYLSHQRLTHQTMLDTLAVLKTHAGPEMVTVLSDAETKIAGHLRTAQELSMRVDKQED